MPIYEYVCPDCKSEFELLRPLSQASDTAPCPRCHQAAERILSTFACFSKDDSGMTSSVGGDSCGGCGATNCGTCGL